MENPIPDSIRGEHGQPNSAESELHIQYNYQKYITMDKVNRFSLDIKV